MTPLPSLRALAASLRELHAAWAHPDAGGEYVVLVDAGPDVGWILEHPDHPDGIGREYVPGDGARFDAVGAARRLLTAARDAAEEDIDPSPLCPCGTCSPGNVTCYGCE